MGQKIWQVDAFTPRAFGGNPAAVCVMERAGDEAWMQQVAMEMNLAETAFVWPEGEGFRLRWFTPTVEVDLCGHATLATSHVLWEEGFLDRGRAATYETRSGTLTARATEKGIELNFPSDPPREEAAPEGLVKAVGAKPVYSGLGKLAYLLELEDEAAVRALAPDFGEMAKASRYPVIATARSASEKFDFVSRFFAPTMGINEDPVTGAAHCCLAPYWQERLGRKGLKGFQASARGGEVDVLAEGGRVALIGQAVMVMKGELV